MVGDVLSQQQKKKKGGREIKRRREADKGRRDMAKHARRRDPVIREQYIHYWTCPISPSGGSEEIYSLRSLRFVSIDEVVVGRNEFDEVTSSRMKLFSTTRKGELTSSQWVRESTLGKQFAHAKERIKNKKCWSWEWRNALFYLMRRNRSINFLKAEGGIVWPPPNFSNVSAKPPTLVNRFWSWVESANGKMGSCVPWVWRTLNEFDPLFQLGVINFGCSSFRMSRTLLIQTFSLWSRQQSFSISRCISGYHWTQPDLLLKSIRDCRIQASIISSESSKKTKQLILNLEVLLGRCHHCHGLLDRSGECSR